MLLRTASVLVRRVAEPRTIGDSVKTAIARAARRLGWKYSRTKDVWYANARRIDADEMDSLRQEASRQAALYERIARSMDATDPHFFSADIAALVESARTLRGMAGAGIDTD